MMTEKASEKKAPLQYADHPEDVHFDEVINFGETIEWLVNNGGEWERGTRRQIEGDR